MSTDNKKLKTESKKNPPQNNKEQKKKVIEVENDEDIVEVTKSGYIEMRVKKKDWKAVHCVLIGGSFYWSKTNFDPVPKGSIHLNGYKINSPIELKGEKKKKFIFAIQKGEENSFIGSCSADIELKAWISAITSNLDKEQCSPPPVNTQKGKKLSVKDRIEKNALNTTTKGLGKEMVKSVINDEAKTLLNALKLIVKAESGSTKKADDLEKNIIKIAVKSFILIKNKTLHADDFLVADKPLREGFELMVKVFNGRGRVRDDKITSALVKVEELLKKTEEVITNLLAPYMKPKNMFLISSTFCCIANEQFLNTVFRNDALEPELEKLIDAMEYYTQFHYH